MDVSNLSQVITLIIALAVATERIVEITKGFVPWLDQQRPDPRTEAQRKAMLQLLAALGGIVVSFLAWPITQAVVPPGNKYSTILALGLLASGGSGFWNSILSYVGNLKALKETQAARAKRAEDDGRPIPHPREGVLAP